jgi:hypothetical protein
VLLLVVGGVAGPNRACALVARQLIERLLGERVLTVDPVQDLHLVLVVFGDVGDEVEEVVGLPVEAERVSLVLVVPWAAARAPARLQHVGASR